MKARKPAKQSPRSADREWHICDDCLDPLAAKIRSCVTGWKGGDVHHPLFGDDDAFAAQLHRLELLCDGFRGECDPDVLMAIAWLQVNVNAGVARELEQRIRSASRDARRYAAWQHKLARTESEKFENDIEEQFEPLGTSTVPQRGSSAEDGFWLQATSEFAVVGKTTRVPALVLEIRCIGHDHLDVQSHDYSAGKTVFTNRGLRKSNVTKYLTSLCAGREFDWSRVRMDRLPVPVHVAIRNDPALLSRRDRWSSRVRQRCLGLISYVERLSVVLRARAVDRSVQSAEVENLPPALGLDRNSLAVLKELAKQPKERRLFKDLASDLGISSKTISECVNDVLVPGHLVHLRGERGGVAITEKGLKFVQDEAKAP